MIGAEFLGMIMLIVYVGAVAVLFLFVVMMINVGSQQDSWLETKKISPHVPVGMLVGLIFTASYIIYFKFMSPELNTAENWFFSISPEGIGFVGMLLNVSVALFVSSLTSPPPKEVSLMVEGIRQP